MPWTTLATTDVLNEFTPAEQTALQAIQGGSTNLGLILTKVVKQARSQVNAGGNQLDQTGLTVPDSLTSDIIAIVRWKWLASFPNLKFLATSARKDANDAGEARLKNLASQKADRERTELPAIVDATPVPIIQPSIGCPKLRRFRHEDGIV